MLLHALSTFQQESNMAIFSFYKMHGAGNDFIFVPQVFPKETMATFAKRLCNRTHGIGADGMVFLEQGQQAFTWHFYNVDGSRGEMCGNAARCAFALAHFLGWIEDGNAILHTDDGPVSGLVHTPLHPTQEAKSEEACLPEYAAEYTADISVALTPPHSLAMNKLSQVAGLSLQYHLVWVGVPHVVCLMENHKALQELDVEKLGKALRNHKDLAPHGANINFIYVESPNTIHIRTYERGVEGETEACGTGSAASVFVCSHAGLTGQHVRVIPKSKEILGIKLEESALFLRGPATLVFHGEYGIAGSSCPTLHSIGIPNGCQS